MNKRKLQLVDKALGRLKPEHRKAFLLHRVEGLSYRQISDQLAVSESTIEKYISAALVAIRSELARSEVPKAGWKP
jgi:RNA polymerase sigma-70 factor (ECF subfamily)